LVLQAGSQAADADQAAESGDTTALALLTGGGFVLLDTTTTAELEAEGFARDLIRAVQDTRKSAGFEVSDRIRLDLVFFDDKDAATFALAAEVDVPTETLTTRFATHRAADSDAELLTATLPSEWLPGLVGAPVEHYVRFEAGQYANQGAVLVAVARENGLIHV